MAKLDGLGYILLDEPLTDHNMTDVLKRRKIIPFFEFRFMENHLLIEGNYYFRPTIIYDNIS